MLVNGKGKLSYANESLNHNGHGIFNKLGSILLFLRFCIKAIWYGIQIYRWDVLTLIAPLSNVIRACLGPNETYIIANFQRYLNLIGTIQYIGDTVSDVTEQLGLPVLKCGLHCEDWLIWSRAQTSWAISWVVDPWEPQINWWQCSFATSLGLKLLPGNMWT